MRGDYTSSGIDAHLAREIDSSSAIIE